MVTAEYVYMQSIVDEQGSIETRVTNGAQLNHKGDAIVYKGMAPMQNYPGTYGTILQVFHAYETGDISMLPSDYTLELQPNQTATVRNVGAQGIDYNVKIRAVGPLYEAGVYQGYTTDVVPPPPPPPPEPTAYGPIMTRLMAFPFMQRFAGGREMSLKAGPRTGSGLPSKPIPTTIIPRVIIPRVASPPQTAPPPRRNGHPGGKTRKGGS